MQSLVATLFKLLAVASFCCVLSACAASGPSRRELIGSSENPNFPYVLVDVTPDTAGRVAAWHHPTFGAQFGDYRGASTQRLGAGDSVQITIWEAGTGGVFATPTSDIATGGATRTSPIPEQVVAKDGSIAVPYAGRIKVAGLTTEAVESAIVKALSGRTSQPQALVTLTHSISHTATVTGDVTNSARVPLSGAGDRLLDVIASAGGIKVPIHEAVIGLSRNGTTLNVPMQEVVANQKENVFVRSGDVVTVYRQPLSFTAVGATGRNAVIPFDASGLTLEEAIGKAGGLLDSRADPTGIFILRYEPAQLVRGFATIPPSLAYQNAIPVVYHLNVKDAPSLFLARRFAMRDKDILYVTNAPVSEVEKIFRVLGAIAAPTLNTVAVDRGIP